MRTRRKGRGQQQICESVRRKERRKEDYPSEEEGIGGGVGEEEKKGEIPQPFS